MNFGKSQADKLQDNIAKRGGQMADGIEHALDNAHAAAQDTLATVSDKLDSAHAQAKPTIDRFAERSAEFAQKGIAATRDVSSRATAAARRYANACETYVVEQPVKSVAIAAAAGATIAAVIMLSRSRSRKAANRFGLNSY
jgi:ElaB/YqjD/DUF883 family membrane-anchored ribosome-binding protein